MAQQQASLFGPTPDEIMEARRQQEQKAQQENYMATLGAVKGDVPGFATGYAMGYGGGQSLGKAVGGLFGLTQKDPMLEKATKMQKIATEFEGLDFNDPGTLQRIAVKLQQEGLYDEAMNVFDRSILIQEKLAEIGKTGKTKYQNLSVNDTIKISGIADNVAMTKDLLNSWNDDYIADVPFGGDFENWYIEWIGSDDPRKVAQANWWKNYQEKKNVIRNTLFGGALTPTEKREWDKQDITANTQNVQMIRDKLRRQVEIAEKGWQRLSVALVRAGYDPDVIKGMSQNQLSDFLQNDKVTEELEAQTTTGPMRGTYNFEPGTEFDYNTAIGNFGPQVRR